MTVVSNGGRGATPEDFFRGMFAQHYGSVFAYCARRIGRDGAADATSEVFAVSWRKIRLVPGEPETLAWLYGVARNVVANHRRSQARRNRLTALVAANTEYVSRDQQQDLDAALAQLRDDDREVLMLVAWEGLGSDDLGCVLGCSASAATVRVHRARRRLSAAWDALEGER
jgi:RNA polymerase sigma-70 factor (ECF subfamily)